MALGNPPSECEPLQVLGKATGPRRRALPSLLLVLILQGVGCTHAGHVGDLPGGAVATPTSSGPPPEALLVLAPLAEGVFVQALAGDGAALRETLSKLEERWSEARRSMLEEGASEDSLKDMDAAVSRLRRLHARGRGTVELSRGADAVSLALIELLLPYERAPSIRLLLLDYLSREILLDGLQGEFASAALRLSTLERTWAGLVPYLIDAGARPQAVTHVKLVRVMSTAVRHLDAQSLCRAALRALAVQAEMRRILSNPLSTTL